MAAAKFSPADFAKIRDRLKTALTDGLNHEIQDSIWETDPTTDLWDLPTVDSKTVCKLSPIVEAATGHKLKPSWVRKGGYDSVDNAVTDVIAHLEQDCVQSAAVAAA